MRCHRYVGFGLSVACLLLGNARGVAEVTFRPLPSMRSGGESSSVSISYDGATVVGNFLAEGGVGGFPAVASLWKLPDATVQDLQGPGLKSGNAHGVSADGGIVAGWFVRPESEIWFNEAFRWTADEGMVPLAPLAPDTSTQALNVSGDGNVIVGMAVEDALYRATVWTGDEAPRRLDDLGIPGVSSAGAASFDGTTIVGTIGQSAAIWREGVAEPILLSFNPSHYASATDVSPDGKFVVGSGGVQAFLYSDELGLIGLGHLEGYQYSSAATVSADGRFIGGIAADFSGDIDEYEAVIQGPGGHWRTVKELLESHGVETEWDLQGLVDMTPDGRTLVGFGLNEQGVRQAWAITIPEPSAVALAALAAPLLLIARRRPSNG